MRGRFKLLTIFGGAAVCAALLWLFRPAPSVFTATYQDRTLEQWTADLLRDDTPANREEALMPIRILCSNNLPALVAALDREPDRRLRLVRKIGPIVSRLPASWRDRLGYNSIINRPLRRSEAASMALQVLGPEAEAVVPQLEKLTMSNDQWVLEQAFTVLSQLGTNGLAYVLSAVEDPRRLRRDMAFVALESHAQLGTNASPALLPVLLRSLQSNDPVVVRYAAMELWFMGMQPAITVPALITALSNPDEHARGTVIDALGSFGPSARAAVPALTRTLGDPSPYVRTQAEIALRRIAPVTLTNTPRSSK